MSRHRGAKGPKGREPPAPFEPFTEIDGLMWARIPPEPRKPWAARVNRWLL